MCYLSLFISFSFQCKGKHRPIKSKNAYCNLSIIWQLHEVNCITLTFYFQFETPGHRFTTFLYSHYFVVLVVIILSSFYCCHTAFVSRTTDDNTCFGCIMNSSQELYTTHILILRQRVMYVKQINFRLSFFFSFFLAFGNSTAKKSIFNFFCYSFSFLNKMSFSRTYIILKYMQRNCIHFY